MRNVVTHNGKKYPAEIEDYLGCPINEASDEEIKWAVDEILGLHDYYFWYVNEELEEEWENYLMAERK